MKEHCLKALWLCPCVQACLMFGGGCSHKWGVEISLHAIQFQLWWQHS